jgi:AcrR family transcriptional regulator
MHRYRGLEEASVVPKRVDHAERRRHIAEAVWSLVARRGMEAVSLRAVAVEAGISMGLVQHYFKTKEDLLLFACQHMVDRAAEGIPEVFAPTADPAAARAVIRSVCVRTLPLDAMARAGATVWLAFLSRAMVHPQLGTYMREAWSGTHEFVAGQLRLAREHGRVAADLDPDGEAVALLSAVDGLVAHLVIGHYTGAQALAVVDDHLERLFG